MPRKSTKPKPPQRSFAIWFASGAVTMIQAKDLFHAARTYRRAPEPAAEMIAVVDFEHMIRPEAVKAPVVFAVSGSKKT